MMLYRYIVLSLSLMIARKFNWKPCLFTFVILWLARWPIRDSLQPIVKLATLKVARWVVLFDFLLISLPLWYELCKIKCKKKIEVTVYFTTACSTILGFMKSKDLPITEAVFNSLVTGPCPCKVSGECCWFGAAVLCLVHLCWVTCVCTGTWTVLKASYQSWKVLGLSRAQTLPVSSQRVCWERRYCQN